MAIAKREADELINVFRDSRLRSDTIDDPRGSLVSYSARDDDMTAIAIVSMTHGLIIGADGQGTDIDSRVAKQTEIQKIFLFQDKGFRLVYALTGIVAMSLRHVCTSILQNFPTSGRNRFPSFTRMFEGSLRKKCPGNLGELANSCAPPVEISLLKNRFGNQVGRIFLAGYFENELCIGAFTIGYPKLELNIGVDIRKPALNGPGIFAGPDSSDYLKSRPQSALEAAGLVRDYLRTCSEDPEHPEIGGRIHIASLTPDEFAWIDRPADDN
jgi:hypothetical protein